jgi:hypothetical protein
MKKKEMKKDRKDKNIYQIKLCSYAENGMWDGLLTMINVWTKKTRKKWQKPVNTIVLFCLTVEPRQIKPH